MTSRTGLGALPRRRNGKQQACEPCRKGSYGIPFPIVYPVSGAARCLAAPRTLDTVQNE
jgi:hypothetical protein